MNNKIFLYIIYLSVFLMLIGLAARLAGNYNDDGLFLSVGTALFMLTGIFLLLRNGNFIKSRQYPLLGIGVALFCIGILFKIMHWSYSFEAIVSGPIVVMLVYSWYLIRTKERNWTHILKFISPLCLLASRIFGLMHWPYSKELLIISVISMMVLMIDFILKENKRNR